MKQSKTPKHNATRILLIDKFITPDKAFGSYPDVFLATVATLDDETKTPRNWSRPYSDDRIKNDMGGFTVRAFLSDFDDKRMLSSVKARRVESDSAEEYLEVAASLKAMEARASKIYATVGGTRDHVEALIRHITCLNVSEVFERAEGSNDTWLHKGEWKRYTTGYLADNLRRTFAAVATSAA